MDHCIESSFSTLKAHAERTLTTVFAQTWGLYICYGPSFNWTSFLSCNPMGVCELKCSSSPTQRACVVKKSRLLKNESPDIVSYEAEIELFINVVQDSRQRRSQKWCHAMGLDSQEVLHIRLSTHSKEQVINGARNLVCRRFKQTNCGLA